MRRKAPLLSFTLLVILSLFFIFRNFLYKQFYKTTAYTQTAGEDVFNVQLSPQLSPSVSWSGTTYRFLKITLPIEFTKFGCEFIYGVAAASFAGAPEWEVNGYYASPRYLIRFQYDLKNRRCESKDLSFFEGDFPKDIKVQLVRVAVYDNYVSEEPEEKGLQIVFQKSDKDISFKLNSISVPPSLPFTEKTKTLRNFKFSANLKGDQVQLLLPPYDDIGKFISEELEKRIEKCRLGQGCDEVRIAVGRISNKRIIRLIGEGYKAGLKIHILLNGNVRWLTRGNYKGEVPFSPLFWLRGRVIDGFYKGFLPMHVKFAVFGSDLVISNNTNYDFSPNFNTKEAAIVYSSREIADIFKEIYTIIKTNIYYPVQVDLRDSVKVLLHAERDVRYSAMNKKPYLSMITNEGVSSSGYGIALELMSRSIKPIFLNMSPISDYCYVYRKKICFFDMLSGFQSKNMLDIALNGYFYVKELQKNSSPDASFLRTSPEFLENPELFSDGLQKIRDLFKTNQSGLSLYFTPASVQSTLHFRSGVIGDETVINGSANFVFPDSINTIEFIDNQDLAARLRKEFLSHREPYYIIDNRKYDITSEREGRIEYKNCTFLFERNVLSRDSIKSLQYKLSDISKELFKNHAINIDKTWHFAEPADIERIFTENGYLSRAEIELKPLQEHFQAYSSYLCIVSPDKNETYIVRTG